MVGGIVDHENFEIRDRQSLAPEARDCLGQQLIAIIRTDGGRNARCGHAFSGSMDSSAAAFAGAGSPGCAIASPADVASAPPLNANRVKATPNARSSPAPGFNVVGRTKSRFVPAPPIRAGRTAVMEKPGSPATNFTGVFTPSVKREISFCASKSMLERMSSVSSAPRERSMKTSKEKYGDGPVQRNGTPLLVYST